MNASRAEARTWLVEVLGAFAPPSGFNPALTWRQEPRSAWEMSRAGFSLQSGAWGLRLPAEMPIPGSRGDASDLRFEVLVGLQLSPVQATSAEDALADAFVDALAAHLFDARVAGASAERGPISVTSPVPGWLLVSVQGSIAYLYAEAT